MAAPGLNVTLRRPNDTHLDLTLEGKTTRVPLECHSESTEVGVADYNFDGVKDVAVPTSVGYGGVNVFGPVYFLDARTRTFRASTEVEFGNSTPDPKRRVLEGGVKSGPAYSIVTRCLTPDGLNFFTCRELRPEWASNNADDFSAHWLSPDGRTLAERPFDPARPGLDITLWTVATPRAFFHDRPDARTRQNRYVIRGDRVEVIELRGTWARAAYTAPGGRVTVGWLSRTTLK